MKKDETPLMRRFALLDDNDYVCYIFESSNADYAKADNKFESATAQLGMHYDRVTKKFSETEKTADYIAALRELA